MEYHLLTYSLLFLPAVIMLYNFTPVKYRWIVLLITDYVFFWMISGPLIFFFLLTTATTYAAGNILEHNRKKHILAVGILIPLCMLIVFKYFKLIDISLTAPIGISYYTLQSISYMTDIYRRNIKPDKSPIKVALYLSFFPQIMEGPISRYSETADALFAGKDITYHNLTYGYQRILWGLFKKMMIADRIATVVYKIFKDYQQYDGSAIAVAAICYTIQLYMEFSGCMDIILGSGEIFGIQLPENFRQPFFADNASDFWRRWHITLGTWLKDYIFYPVSLAKPVKKISKLAKKSLGINVSKYIAPSIALFFVWLCNGIWHGAGPTYLFYGMYYFVLIFIETITELSFRKFNEKHHIDPQRLHWRLFRTAKLMIIVVIGELFFRAPTLTQGFAMFHNMLMDFHFKTLIETDYGIDKYDILLALIGILIVLVVDILHENNICLRDKISTFGMPVRWSLWYAMIFSIIITGAYGAGYTVMDMLYAAY